MFCSDFLNQYQSTWSEPEAPETNWSEPETPETNRRSETELSSQHGFIKTGLQPKQNGTTLDLGIRLGPMLRVKNNITLSVINMHDQDNGDVNCVACHGLGLEVAFGGFHRTTCSAAEECWANNFMHALGTNPS